MLPQQAIKVTNQKRLYTLIHRYKGVSRAKLATLTKLSKPTVSTLVDDMIANGLIRDKGAAYSKKAGRKPNALAVNDDDNCFIVFSWRRDAIVVSLLNASYDIIQIDTIQMKGEANYVEHTISGLWRELERLPSHKRVLSTCVVIPAIIDDQTGEVISSVLGIKSPTSVVEAFGKANFPFPISILNDTACYAYAEYSRNIKDLLNETFIFLNISSGIGCVLLDRGTMFRGATGMTTQFGHLTIARNGAPCSCGNQGCLESLVGEIALPYRAKEFDAKDLFTNNQYNFQALRKMVDRKDPKAIKLLTVIADDLAFGLGNLISLFHPSQVVIGGTGVALGPEFLILVMDSLQQYGYPLFTKNVSLRFSQLGEVAELQGAAEYYMDNHFKFFEDSTPNVIIG